MYDMCEKNFLAFFSLRTNLEVIWWSLINMEVLGTKCLQKFSRSNNYVKKNGREARTVLHEFWRRKSTVQKTNDVEIKKSFGRFLALL